MAQEKILRPDSARLKALLAEADSVDSQLKQISESQRSQRKQVQDAAQALYDARLRQALEEMDVDHINKAKQGIRISILRDAGIENVYQASGLSYRYLCQLDGIGEQTARKIQDTVKQIRENTKKSLRIRLEAQAGDPENEALVRSLYIWRSLEPLRPGCKQMYRAGHNALCSLVATARKGLGGFAWMFRSQKSKEQILEAGEKLGHMLCYDYGGPLLQQCRLILEADSEAYFQDLRLNAADYYAQLEAWGYSWSSQAVEGGLDPELTQKIQAQPLDLTGLKATLRGYQTFGVQYILHQKRVLLGDEMGLGKTIQAIASMVAMKAQGGTHFMVVCPASVLINWCREIQRFSNLAVTKVHGDDPQALLHWRENGDVAVTTFETISRFTLPERFPIGMVITDEAHYVKNPEAQRTQALLKLLAKTDRVLFMSGTPLENRVEEMCFLVKCLQPELAAGLEQVKYLSTAQQFRQQLAPVYLRRTREDVLTELPELVEKAQWCQLGSTELQDYRAAVRSGNFMAIRQVSWQVDDLNASSKAHRLLEICCQAQEQGRKVIVFSFFRNTLQKVLTLLADRCLEPITGEISPQRRQEIVDEFTKAKDGTVLVSQVQAGGTGLNIQAASVIVFCEPQIKPSIENQAIARAYRMGQVRDVLVYRLLADDTIDEQLLELLRTKQEQFDSFADESVVGSEFLQQEQQTWIKEMVGKEQKRLEEAP